MVASPSRGRSLFAGMVGHQRGNLFSNGSENCACSFSVSLRFFKIEKDVKQTKPDPMKHIQLVSDYRKLQNRKCASAMTRADQRLLGQAGLPAEGSFRAMKTFFVSRLWWENEYIRVSKLMEHFEWVHFVICQFHLNKVDFKSFKQSISLLWALIHRF